MAYIERNTKHIHDRFENLLSDTRSEVSSILRKGDKDAVNRAECFVCGSSTALEELFHNEFLVHLKILRGLKLTEPRMLEIMSFVNNFRKKGIIEAYKSKYPDMFEKPLAKSGVSGLKYKTSSSFIMDAEAVRRIVEADGPQPEAPNGQANNGIPPQNLRTLEAALRNGLPQEIADLYLNLFN